MHGKDIIEFLFSTFFIVFNSYIHRRDLRTILPTYVNPRSSKTIAADAKPNTLKRPKLDSTSSDSGLVADLDVETKAKRPKLEETNEPSPKTSEPDVDTV
jgi:hypothetical protein